MDTIRPGALVLVAILLARAATAAATMSQCGSRKVKAAGAAASSKANCYEKAVLTGIGVKPACLERADNAVTAAFAQAESRDGGADCLSRGDAADIGDKVNGFIAELRATVNAKARGPSICDATKIQAAGRTADARARCAASGEGFVAADPECLSKAESKFGTTVARAEDQADCTHKGQADALEEIVDAFIADLVEELASSFSEANCEGATDYRGRTLVDRDGHPPLVLEEPGCYRNAVIAGDYPTNASWEYMHDSLRNHGGVELQAPGITVEDFIISNVEDGVRVREENFHFRRIAAAQIFDDCIDDHENLGGVVEDSIFDGCYTGISARPNHGQDGRGKTITLRRNKIRLEPKSPHSAESRASGHGPFFKWGETSPDVVFEDNVLLAEQNTDSEDGMLIPTRVHFASCRGNTLVWLGSEPPRLAPLDRSCLRITTDPRAWSSK